MSLQDRWDGLSPTLRRGLVLGGAAAALLALVALLVSAPKDERAGRADERRRLITNLLTDADPRAIGIEGLAERLRRLENHTDQLSASLDKLGLGKGVDPERDAIIEGLRRENARQLGELRLQQQVLREELAAASTAPVLSPAGAPQPPVARQKVPMPTSPRKPRPLNQLFEPLLDTPRGQRETLRLPAAAASDTKRSAKALEIRIVAADATEEGGDALPEDAVLIPAGSILRGVLLSGMDAPMGRQSRRDPYPALARIKHDAILPGLPRRRARVLPGARRLRGPRERAGLPAYRGHHLRAPGRRRH